MGLIAKGGGCFSVVRAIMLLILLVQMQTTTAKTHSYSWNVETTNVTRNCETVSITTVNGQYPGPTIEIDEGDTVVVNVTNLSQYEVSVHWHGIFQYLSNWADGPAHITQCPIMFGSSQIYEFTVTGQSGTFFWHAHNNWLRATVFGAFIVHPAVAPPYGEVDGEFSILSGEWYGADPNAIEQGYINTPQPPNENYTVASAVNGQPGPKYGCPDTQIFQVTKGSTYLVRLTNAGLNYNHYFKVANHTLTVVGADGNYLKPFASDYAVISPGQTTNVLFTANQSLGSYYYGVSVADFPTGIPGELPPAAAGLGIFEYEGSDSSASPMTPEFPMITDTIPVMTYTASLKGMDLYNLPETPDHELVYVVGIARVDCTANETSCVVKLAGTVQNITFVEPQGTNILQAYYDGVDGVYTTDFPDTPTVFDDFTSMQNINYTAGMRGTRVRELQFGDTVQLVLQNVNALGNVDHPFHLHGQDFYVVGSNQSNFDPKVDPLQFNLVDPPKFNTFTVPNMGWVAIRFQANNPGVWLLHCHFERHKTWGMEMVFITNNGNGENETLPGPLHPGPPCS